LSLPSENPFKIAVPSPSTAYFPRCLPEDIVFLMHWCYSKLLRLFPVPVACRGNYNIILKVKVKESRNRPNVAQRVPGS